MPISQTPRAPNVGAGLPAIALGINTTLQAVAANANHDAKRAALDLDLLVILISGTPSLGEVPSGGARALLVTFGALFQK